MKTHFWLPLAAALLTAGAASAQRPLVPGEITRGSLSSSDLRSDRGSYYDAYTFQGRRGETVVVQMESRDFDAYLHLGTLRRGTWRELAYDDDGADGRNARIQLQLPDDGTYTVRASSLSRSTGAYTLTLANDGGGYGGDDYDPRPGRDRPRPGREVRGGPVQAGDRLDGSLTSADPTLDGGEPYHLYTYPGRRGERVTITLRSDNFDSYLVLGTRGGRHGVGTVLTRDDDGGGGRDARIDFTLPGDGEYVIRVNPLNGGTGRYVLEVESDLQGGYGRPGRVDDPYDPVRPARQGRGGPVQAGERVDGALSTSDPTLDGGEPYHLYTYQGRRGERVEVSLRSADFDSYLVLGTRGGRHGVGTVLTRDDDGGGNRDARIDFTLPGDGEYVIRVNPLGGGRGRYTLEVESDLQGGYGRPGRDDYDDGYGTVDARLVGRWGLVPPGVRVNAQRWSTVSANARFGYLRVADDGSYTWERDGTVRRGQVEPYAPRGAQPGTDYSRITDGRDEYYVFFAEYAGERYLQVNSAATDRAVAYGYRDPNAR